MTIDEAFFAGLKVASVQWSLSRMKSDTQTRGGDVIRNEFGAALWQGSVTLNPAYHRDAARVEALLAELTGAGQSILAYDPRYNGPAFDPRGIVLGTATPSIHTLDADNRQMRLDGLPSGYQLRIGDYLGFEYSGRYAMHRITSDVITPISGVTPLFSVTPHIRPGAVVGAPVRLVRPVIKCLVQASYGSAAPRITNGAQITFKQTLR